MTKSKASQPSYLWVNDLARSDMDALFERSLRIKNMIQAGQGLGSLKNKQIALFFQEPSTRTKLSFQMAVQRLGGQCLILDDLNSSSMVKGETFSDTLSTLSSLGVDLVVVRCGDQELLQELADQIQLPIVNGGWGRKSHPTQALLDVLTLLERFKTLEGRRVVFVGDIDHSRVAASTMDLLTQYGAEVKICAPEGFIQNSKQKYSTLGSLDEALEWCDVYYSLRVQLERHQGNPSSEEAFQDFIKHFSLNESGLKKLSNDAVVMHPGPVNWGNELASCVLNDQRTLISQQVENGVYVRAALVERLLEKL